LNKWNEAVLRVNLIVARGQNGAIGKNNALLWHLPEDLAYFKAMTAKWPVVMGRKTFDSILNSLGKPLPFRQNVVVTRNSAWSYSGVQTAHSLVEAIDLVKESDEVFVIGGGELYRQTLALDQPLCERAFVTEVELNPQGDVFFDSLPAQSWREIERKRHESRTGIVFSTVVYERVKP
jgi:dihydrofolate reductase